MRVCALLPCVGLDWTTGAVQEREREGGRGGPQPCSRGVACTWIIITTHTHPLTRPFAHTDTHSYPTHARLLQAWALMESKCGKLEEARRLIAAAVENDRSLEPVLRWKLWGLEGAQA